MLKKSLYIATALVSFVLITPVHAEDVKQDTKDIRQDRKELSQTW